MKFDRFISIADQLAQADLPGPDAQLEFLSKNMRTRLSAMKHDLNPRLSGVAAMFYPDDDKDASVILIQRQSYKGVHSGQIAFPGGKYEDEDSSLEYTARREAKEEVGVPIEDPEMIIALTEVYIPPSRFLVKPFIFLLHNQPKLVIDEREVKSMISLKVHDLLNDDNLKLGNVTLEDGKVINTPFFDANGHRVWGATALILNEIKLLLQTKNNLK